MCPMPSRHSLGARVAEVRLSKGWSLDDVAERLLLSRRQVQGLEEGDASAFYGQVYFTKALRKYLVLCELPTDELDEAPEPAEDEQQIALAAANAAAVETTNGRRLWLAAAAGLAVIILAGTAYWWPSRTIVRGSSEAAPAASAEPLPAQPMAAAAAIPPAVQAEPAATAFSDDRAGDGVVRVTAGAATWVFVRYPDNQVMERRLDAGESVTVDVLPVYLAVGEAEGVEVEIANRLVPLEPYIRSGQIRIGRSQLAALHAGAMRP